MMSSPAFAAALQHERKRAERRLERAMARGDESAVLDATDRLADLEEISRFHAPEVDTAPVPAR
ncbi:hypothetical protein BA895_08055 [Humibacillus sp. DSM 29435]|uniref:hypothetical protein n=1 Tax=Humibacillus sp. DSM 29435 TaxID=1869167 RepID=UPI000871FA2F|nr:hypothetical protein [Humibacillus sp. DSM 29435]OFE15070.1 hypothetical protein BA895_08055 [Humibacillus sp. DSM 29435]